MEQLGFYKDRSSVMDVVLVAPVSLPLRLLPQYALTSSDAPIDDDEEEAMCVPGVLDLESAVEGRVAVPLDDLGDEGNTIRENEVFLEAQTVCSRAQAIHTRFPSCSLALNRAHVSCAGMLTGPACPL